MGKLNLKTVNDVLATVTGRGNTTAMLWKDEAGAWMPITSDELYGRVRALADVLRGWGVGKGDRVVLLSENRWEWAVTDFATLALGAVDVPLYATNSPEQVGYMVRDSGAKVAVVSSAAQFEKLQGGDFPALEHVVVMDAGSFAGAESFAALMQGAGERQARDAAFDAAAAQVEADDLATIIYTSGTTGEPKGVKLTHGNLASNVTVAMNGHALFKAGDSCISFLPLSHVTARHVDYGFLALGISIAYCPKFDLLPAALAAVRPTIFVGVPRVYEKIRQGVEAKSAQSSFKNRVLGWALGVGRRNRARTLANQAVPGVGWALATVLVFSRIREAFGGRVHTWISGGAPLGMDTAGWFADVGIRIMEGYGLTETSPVIAVNYTDSYKIGTVGRPLANLEVRFADDGELEVRGPSVFAGYWNKDKETAESFAPDGWFKTGDIGNLDADGFLSITDRKKELLKTSGGKLIAPQPIENKLKNNTLVAQAALVGDKHKFACVLLSPNFEALERWASGRGVGAGDRGTLVKDARVLAEYQRIVDEVNGELPRYETMKRIAVVPDEWTVESGELTPSMKLKRRVVEKKYAAEIDAFYHDEASAKA